MNRVHVLGALALVGIVSGCQLKKPFEATVVAAGASGKNIKHGFFAREQTVTGANDLATDVSLRIDVSEETATPGRVVFNDFEGVVTDVELTPLQIDDEDGAGYVVYDLLDDDHRPDVTTDLVLASWVDDDDDGKLDLSNTGDSEAARTVFLHDTNTGEKQYLNSLSYFPNGDEPYYTAVALTPSIVNVIVTEEILRDWMVVLTADVDKAPPPPDSDLDGLNDVQEQALGTNAFDEDTDFDGENDLAEVGADASAPLDTDGDGAIDAVESSVDDDDFDGVPDETDPA